MKKLSKEQFYAMVKSYNRNPGEFTEDEIFDICEAHKELVSGKNWAEVTQLLGVKRSPESLRKWVYRREEKNGTVRRNINQLTDKTIPELNEKEITSKVTDKLEQLYVEKTKVRDSYNAYRRTLRDEARIESLKESIIQAAEKTRDLPAINIDPWTRNNTTQPLEAILCLSDLHIGVNCDNYYNVYNSDVAAERLSKLAWSTINYCKTHNVKTLHVLNLGDMIQGIIHTSARLEQEFDVTEQIIEAAELLAEFLNLIQKAAPEITYRSVTDNHARAIANYKEHIEKENFSKLIDWFLKAKLSKTRINFLDDNIDDGIGMIILNNGKKVLFAHGHQDGRDNSMQNMIGLTQEWVDYVILAHYHNSSTKQFQGCKVFINGSICGTEQYAFGKRLFSKPTQKLLIFGDDAIIDTDINLE